MLTSVQEEIRSNEIDGLAKTPAIQSMARELYADGALIDWHDGEFKAAILRRHYRLTHKPAPANTNDMRDALHAAWVALRTA